MSYNHAWPGAAQEQIHPQVLYLCDFPPSNYRGGTVLLRRLLDQWPTERLTVLSSARYARFSRPEGRLACWHLFFPMLNPSGRWGLGRLKAALNWLLLPLVIIAALGLVRQRRIGAMISVTHGYFFVAAALVAALTRTSLALIIHDDWLGYGERAILGPLGPLVFRLAARQATMIYAISPQMQAHLLQKYGLHSKLQMPAREPIRVAAPASASPQTELRIVYFGTLNAAVDDSIEALVHVVNGASLEQYGVERCRLDLYTLLPQSGTYQSWASERVRFHPWVSQAEAQAILLGADLLLLPFSFRADQRHLTERSFPSKAADYLAAARPILVIAPPDSTVALYATAQGFAEVVCAPDASQIAAAIGRIATDGEHRARLSSAARATFDQHHDLFQQQRELVADLQQLCR